MDSLRLFLHAKVAVKMFLACFVFGIGLRSPVGFQQLGEQPLIFSFDIGAEPIFHLPFGFVYPTEVLFLLFFGLISSASHRQAIFDLVHFSKVEFISFLLHENV